MKIPVIAGSYEQFLYCTESNHSKYRYLALLPMDLFGYSDTTLILLDNWYKRRDVDEDFLLEYCKVHNITIMHHIPP